MRRFRTTIVVALATLLSFSICTAQQITTTSVPNLIRYSGTLKDAQGAALSSSAAVGVTFSLYKQQEGGAPVWMETQNVTPDANGQYNVILGSTTATGLPDDLFSQQEQRWLGVQVQGQDEQARVLLVSVPYAFKAHEAETLGGLPASAFVKAPPTDTLSDDSNSTALNALENSGKAGGKSNGKGVLNSRKPPACTGVITATLGNPLNVIPMWDGLSLCNLVNTPTGGTAIIQGNLTANSYAIGINTVLGVSATRNLFVGEFAGTNNTGNFNTFVGWNSGDSNTGIQNTFVGIETGPGNTGGQNAFFGYRAGFNNAAGSSNTCIGYQSCYTFNAMNNTIVGRSGGFFNSGNNVTFLGFGAGYNNTADNNTFIGYQAGTSNTSGYYNTFVGYLAGTSNTTASNGTFGQENTFVGYQAGMGSKTSQGNTFVGSNAGLVSGSNHPNDCCNTFVGKNAGMTSQTSNNTMVGYRAGESTTGGTNTLIGNKAGAANTTGIFNTFLGADAGFNDNGTGNTTGSQNTYVGTTAGGGGAGHTTTGSNNIFLGYGAGVAEGNVSNNIEIGATGPAHEAGSGPSNQILIGVVGKYRRDAGTQTDTYIQGIYMAPQPIFLPKPVCVDMIREALGGFT